MPHNSLLKFCVFILCLSASLTILVRCGHMGPLSLPNQPHIQQHEQDLTQMPAVE